MTLLEDVDALKTRLARVLSERDAWRAAGLQEKYLEAYSMVEALELRFRKAPSTTEELSSRKRHSRFALPALPGTAWLLRLQAALRTATACAAAS